MNKPITIDDASFDEKVLKAKTPVLVDFWAPWCRPCLMVSPILDELAEEYGEKITIARLDVDQSPQAAAKYSVMAIPTMLIFKDGQPVTNVVGFHPKEDLKQSIDAVLD